jgi:hypothetical protein
MKNSFQQIEFFQYSLLTFTIFFDFEEIIIFKILTFKEYIISVKLAKILGHGSNFFC